MTINLNQISYTETISTLAFVTALGALAWNIVRDFIVDRVSIEFSIAYGEMGSIKDSTTATFADAGSLIPTHRFDTVSMLVQIVNTGRRPIGIARVGGKLKDGNDISIAVQELPKMLQPYEIFFNVNEAKPKFLEMIKKDEIEKLWVRDTTNKKWYLSGKGWERLKTTANYIILQKHQ